jgi:predicted mannosyl-3-phosphoglycerate phosphatase (HAD superfamily)
MNLSDQLNEQSQSTGTPEGAAPLAAGHELAVAIAGQMQSDAIALASLAEQYTTTKERLADQLAPLFNEALSGQGLMGAVMARLTVQPMEINTTIEAIDIGSLLPKRTDPDLVEKFLAFSAGIQPPALRLPAAYGGTDED